MELEKKIKKTFTIDKKLYETFSALADKLAVNKSKFIENKIRDFIKHNENE